MSFFLIFVLSLPFLINADYIMHLWLVNVPDHATGFFCVLLIYAYIDVFAYPLDTAAQATGKLQTYTLRTSLLLFSILPIGYILFKTGLEPESIYIVAIVVGILGLLARLVTLKRNIQVSLFKFIQVFLRCTVVAAMAFGIAWLIHCVYYDSIFAVTLTFLFCFSESLCLIYLLGLDRQERIKLKAFIYNKIKKRNNN